MPSFALSNEPPSGDHLGCLCHRPEFQSLSRRIGAELSRRSLVAGMAAAISSLGLLGPPRPRRPRQAIRPRPPFLPICGYSTASPARCAKQSACSSTVTGSKRSGRQPATSRWRASDRLRGQGSDAGPNRRALAFDLCGASAPDTHGRRCRLHLSCRERRGGAHADARLHDGS